jgi:LytS/YehU family sensor histidine kinase
MLRQSIFKYRVLLLHVSFWVLYFSYRVYDLYDYLGLKKGAIYTGLPMFFNVIVCYVHYFFILPVLFRDKQWKKYARWLIILLLPIITLRILAENQIFIHLTSNENYYNTVKLTRMVSTVWDTLSFLLFTGMIRFVLDWFELENKKNQLENEKLVAELNYLKSQINPHFLFNTLHNLNYLVYAGSANATEVIIKLSNIMRYMIYDAGKEQVLLPSEIEYMNDYIHLESIRLNQVFQLDFPIHGAIDQVKIAPLMLIPFLENAFKHGVSDQETNCWIKIKLVIENDQLHYHVSNKKLKMTIQNKLKSGFGLSNVKKRLALSYPDKHTLEVIDTDEIYQIDLTLQLK